jgi:hypothetical protein
MMGIRDITHQKRHSLASFPNETINLAVTNMTAAEMFVKKLPISHIGLTKHGGMS